MTNDLKRNGACRHGIVLGRDCHSCKEEKQKQWKKEPDFFDLLFFRNAVQIRDDAHCFVLTDKDYSNIKDYIKIRLRRERENQIRKDAELAMNAQPDIVGAVILHQLKND